MGGLCPDKGLGMGVVVRNVVVDGGGELGHTFEDTATNTVGGYFSETLHASDAPLIIILFPAKGTTLRFTKSGDRISAIIRRNVSVAPDVISDFVPDKPPHCCLEAMAVAESTWQVIVESTESDLIQGFSGFGVGHQPARLELRKYQVPASLAGGSAEVLPGDSSSGSRTRPVWIA